MDKKNCGCSGGEERPGVIEVKIARLMVVDLRIILGYFCYFGHFAMARGQTNISSYN